LIGWASNASAYDALLHQVFGAAGTEASTWSLNAGALREQLLGAGLGLALELLPAGALPGLRGAYTAVAPGGSERVYLNTSWLQNAGNHHTFGGWRRRDGVLRPDCRVAGFNRGLYRLHDQLQTHARGPRNIATFEAILRSRKEILCTCRCS
ncbi:hypothetical protein, partial [Cyanobium sp. Morenito 9A2]|uniref:hypothetical protein n=1 Tax=Cyanobium sp. Morenito 9A2 TaxID=2823718 RepID=UPI0020CC226D